jgi:hypothetical protein
MKLGYESKMIENWNISELKKNDLCFTKYVDNTK